MKMKESQFLLIKEQLKPRLAVIRMYHGVLLQA